MADTGEELRQLFMLRTASADIEIDEDDAPAGSRVGGVAPQALAERAPTCPRCGGGLEYVWTLGEDVLSPEVAQGQELSLLCCRDLGCRMASHVVTAPSSLVLLAHVPSPRAAGPSALDGTFEGRRLLRRPVASDSREEEEDRSKVGGAPWYLQGDDYGMEPALKQQGQGLLLQWSENTYRRDMRRGTYPFCFGVVYVFSRLDPVSGVPRLEDVVGFWQNS